ncbi:MAG: TolC family protein [Flavobacteriaceae bacterium]|nr:TolC family protein [Flavobacteriaceae bacterium]
MNTIYTTEKNNNHLSLKKKLRNFSLFTFHFSLFIFHLSLKKKLKNFSLFTFHFSLKKIFFIFHLSLKKKLKNFSLFTFHFSLKKIFFIFHLSLKKKLRNFSLFTFHFSLKKIFFIFHLSLKKKLKNFSLFTFHFSLKRAFFIFHLSFFTSYGQTNFSLEDAITYSLSNNGSIKSADLEVERLKTLKKTAYDFGKTDLDFQYGRFNSFENDFSFSIGQKFQFPTVYSNQKKLAKSNIEIGKSKKTIRKNNLIKDIKQTWYQLAYLKEKGKLLKYKDSVYKHFLRAAVLRYKVEAGTLLEKVTAETKMTTIKIALTQNEANLKIYQKKLQTLLGNPNVIDITENYNPKKEFNLTIDTSKIVANPNLNLLKNQISVSEKKIALNKSKMLPDITLGYTNQSLIGDYTINGVNQFFGSNQRFSSVTATISIPLWIKPDKARIKASKIQQQKTIEDAKYYRTVLNGEYERVLQDYLKYKNTVAYYEDKALPQATLILSNAKKSFENDAIGYIEYIQGLDTGIEIKNNYLNLINQYNQSIIAIEYLLKIY